MARRWMISLLGFATIAACTPATDDDAGVVLGGSDTTVAPSGAMVDESGARATMRDGQGNEVGTVTMRPSGGGVEFTVALSGLQPGVRAIHVHETARCDAPTFASAGGHFAPADRQHGLENPEGPHAGDLPNLTVDANGGASLTMANPRVTLGTESNSLLRDGGTAIVLHASADDNRTDPSGDAGDRIACGIVERG